MKCPTCQGELVRSKKNPEYLLCYNCRKKIKYKTSIQKRDRLPQDREAESDCKGEEKPWYANVPPEEIRKKSEENVRQAYEDMISAGEEKRSSYAPVIVLVIAILVLIVAGIYLWA